ncbi:hypothetical protein HMPREF2692_04380 [Corynebacterium sp. HMSC036D03]|nr:hypothetical protein HMPREF2692_04380 [Corynebacterium sp. HMSC036D03]
MPAILPTLPAVTVPMAAVIFPAACITRPGHDMGNARRNILVAAGADIKLCSRRAADVAHNEELTVGPLWALDGLRA